MLVYSIIMLAVSLVFVVMSALIYRGNVNLIHDYHRTRVEDTAAYGKAFGKALLPFPLAMIISGVIALLGESKAIVLASIFALLSGMAIGIVLIVIVQRKYNNGVF